MYGSVVDRPELIIVDVARPVPGKVTNLVDPGMRRVSPCEIDLPVFRQAEFRHRVSLDFLVVVKSDFDWADFELEGAFFIARMWIRICALDLVREVPGFQRRLDRQLRLVLAPCDDEEKVLYSLDQPKAADECRAICRLQHVRSRQH